MPAGQFQALGFPYFGPIDGHNLSELIPVLENLKNDSQVTEAITETDLAALFDLGYHLKYVDSVFRRVFGVDG